MNGTKMAEEGKENGFEMGDGSRNKCSDSLSLPGMGVGGVCGEATHSNMMPLRSSNSRENICVAATAEDANNKWNDAPLLFCEDEVEPDDEVFFGKVSDQEKRKISKFSNRRTAVFTQDFRKDQKLMRYTVYSKELSLESDNEETESQDQLSESVAKSHGKDTVKSSVNGGVSSVENKKNYQSNADDTGNNSSEILTSSFLPEMLTKGETDQTATESLTFVADSYDAPTHCSHPENSTCTLRCTIPAGVHDSLLQVNELQREMKTNKESRTFDMQEVAEALLELSQTPRKALMKDENFSLDVPCLVPNCTPEVDDSPCIVSPAVECINDSDLDIDDDDVFSDGPLVNITKDVYELDSSGVVQDIVEDLVNSVLQTLEGSKQNEMDPPLESKSVSDLGWNSDDCLNGFPCINNIEDTCKVDIKDEVHNIIETLITSVMETVKSSSNSIDLSQGVERVSKSDVINDDEVFTDVSYVNNFESNASEEIQNILDSLIGSVVQTAENLTENEGKKSDKGLGESVCSLDSSSETNKQIDLPYGGFKSEGYCVESSIIKDCSSHLKMTGLTLSHTRMESRESTPDGLPSISDVSSDSGVVSSYSSDSIQDPSPDRQEDFTEIFELLTRDGVRPEERLWEEIPAITGTANFCLNSPLEGGISPGLFGEQIVPVSKPKPADDNLELNTSLIEFLALEAEYSFNEETGKGLNEVPITKQVRTPTKYPVAPSLLLHSPAYRHLNDFPEYRSPMTSCLSPSDCVVPSVSPSACVHCPDLGAASAPQKDGFCWTENTENLDNTDSLQSAFPVSVCDVHSPAEGKDLQPVVSVCVPYRCENSEELVNKFKAIKINEKQCVSIDTPIPCVNEITTAETTESQVPISVGGIEDVNNKSDYTTQSQYIQPMDYHETVVRETAAENGSKIESSESPIKNGKLVFTETQFSPTLVVQEVNKPSPKEEMAKLTSVYSTLVKADVVRSPVILFGGNKIPEDMKHFKPAEASQLLTPDKIKEQATNACTQRKAITPRALPLKTAANPKKKATTPKVGPCPSSPSRKTPMKATLITPTKQTPVRNLSKSLTKTPVSTGPVKKPPITPRNSAVKGPIAPRVTPVKTTPAKAMARNIVTPGAKISHNEKLPVGVPTHPPKNIIVKASPRTVRAVHSSPVRSRSATRNATPKTSPQKNKKWAKSATPKNPVSRRAMPTPPAPLTPNSGRQSRPIFRTQRETPINASLGASPSLKPHLSTEKLVKSENLIPHCTMAVPSVIHGPMPDSPATASVDSSNGEGSHNQAVGSQSYQDIDHKQKNKLVPPLELPDSLNDCDDEVFLDNTKCAEETHLPNNCNTPDVPRAEVVPTPPVFREGTPRYTSDDIVARALSENVPWLQDETLPKFDLEDDEEIITIQASSPSSGSTASPTMADILERKREQLMQLREAKRALQLRLASKRSTRQGSPSPFKSPGPFSSSCTPPTTADNLPKVRFKNTQSLGLEGRQLEAVTKLHTMCNGQRSVKLIQKGHAAVIRHVSAECDYKEASRLSWIEDLVTKPEILHSPEQITPSGRPILKERSHDHRYPFSDETPTTVVVTKSRRSSSSSGLKGAKVF